MVKQITALNKKGAVFLFYKGADRQDINAGHLRKTFKRTFKKDIEEGHRRKTSDISGTKPEGQKRFLIASGGNNTTESKSYCWKR